MTPTDTLPQQEAYLTFTLGEEHFATPVRFVKEIIELAPITPVPHAPPYLKGLVNLRGRVIPVVDTRIKFGLEGYSPTQKTRIVVVEVQGREGALEIGAIVDTAREVVQYDREQITEPPSFDDYAHAEFIDGVVGDEEQEVFTMVVNVEKIFSPKELQQLDEVPTPKPNDD